MEKLINVMTKENEIDKKEISMDLEYKRMWKELQSSKRFKANKYKILRWP